MKSSTNRALVAKKQSTSFAQVANNLLNLLQGYTKSIRLLLVMLLTLNVSAEVWGAEETITLSDFGWSNATVQSSITATSATISLAKNSAGTAPTYYTADGLRIYGVKNATTGGTISFSPKKGITISKIVFTHTSSNSGVLAIKTGVGSYSSKTWSGTLTEGSTVSLVSTNNTSSNPQVKVTKIVITYTKAAAKTYNVILSRNGVTETINDVEEGKALDYIDGTGDQGGCSPEWVFEGWSKTQRHAQNNTAVMDLVTTVDGAGPYYAVYSHTDEHGGGNTTATMSSFSEVSGNVNNDANVSYTAAQGTAGTPPGVYSNEIRIYQNGGTLTITGNNGKKLTSITIGSSMKTSVSYKIDGGSKSSAQSITANGKYTLSDIDATSVLFTCEGTDKNSRLYLNYLSVTYSGGNTVYYTTSPQCTTETAVTLNLNEGTGGTTEVTATYGQPMPAITIPTRTGYTFNGYFDAASGGTKYYNANGTSAKNWDKKAATTTLYAQWTAQTYTVTLDNQGATTAGAASVTATYNAVMPSIASKLPQKTGYTFGGYFTGQNGEGTQYYNQSGGAYSNKKWDQATDATLYAKWTANKYTVKFNGNDNTGGSMNDQPFTYGQAQNLTANAFTRTGYTFKEWNTNKSGSGTSYTDGQEVINLNSTSGGQITLYAQWTCETPVFDIKIKDGNPVVFSGESIELTVEGSHIAADATYKWYKYNGATYDELAGETANKLTITEATANDAGNYKCVVTNGTCSAENNYTVKMYHIKGLTDNAWTTPFEFVKSGDKEGTFTIELAATTTYYFKLNDGSVWYWNEGTMTHNNCTEWVIEQEGGDTQGKVNTGITTTASGTYTFTLNYEDPSKPKLSVTYPQKKMVYFNPGNWNCSKYAVYSWEGDNKSTILMTKIDDCAGRNIYQAEIDASHSNVIFIGGTASYNVANTWNNVSYQTIDLTYPSDDNVLYEINTTHLFLVPNSNWKEIPARFAAYFFGNGETWVSMTKVTENLYKVTIPTAKTYPSVIFCRMNPSAAANNWNNKWNQSADLTITKGKNHYTIEEGAWDKGGGTWKTAGDWTAFTPNYTVTFNANGHGTAPDAQCVAENGKATTPAAPTATGYTFCGWYKEAGCANVWDFANDVVTADITLYAKWTINTRTVTWKPAGGNWGGDAKDIVQTYEYGELIEAPDKPIYDCHEFVEWNPAYTVGTTTMPDKDLVFTATWNKLSYTITFKNYDGTVLQTSTVECDETPTYTGAEPTREQTAQYTYTFKGWSPTIAPATQNQVYTAQFTQTTRQYTVTWYDGTGNAQTQTANYNATVALPTTNPERCDDKYPYFIGWTADPIVGPTPTQPELVENVKVTGDCDYYAVFAKGEGGSSNYQKVTSSLDDWSGEYLIVYETGKVAFNGGLSTLDVASNTIGVTISDNTIESNSTTDAARFTIAAVSGGYTIKSASGYYIGQNSYSNGLSSSTSTTYTNTISHDGETITINGTGNEGGTKVALKYNDASNQYRFRYYKSGQKTIALYKKGSGVNYTSYITTCCTSWTAPTLTYTTPLNAEISQTADPQLGSGTTYGDPTYTSSNPSVLAVDKETGVVTAIGKGTATITVTWEGNETYCSVSATSNTITVNGSYSVTFHSNGGTGTMEPQKADPSTQRIAKLNKNEFTKADYVFVGWKDASGVAYTDEQENITLTKNITLFAQWAPIVTLNDAGSEETLNPTAVGGTVTLPNEGANACKPYEFVGWTSVAIADWNEGIEEPALVASPYKPTQPTTLYAVYKIQSEGNANAFKLSFEGGNGKTYYVGSYNNSPYLRGYSNITKEEAVTFIRTKMYPDNDTKYYIYMEHKSEYLYYNGTFNSTSRTPDENQGWVFHTVGDKIKLQSTYSYDPDYLSFSDRDEETINISTSTSGSEFNMLSAVTSTYVAAPLCNQEITITFETGNGDFVANAPTPNPLTKSRGDVITLPTCEYPGYEFMGWMKDEQQLDPSDIIGTYYTGDYTVDGVSSTITFYAYYKAIPEEVEFTGKDDAELLMYYYDGTANYYYAVSHAAERGELSSKQNCFNATTWTFTNVGNMQYYIQDETGKYLGAYSNGDNDLILSATPKVWTFTEVNGLWKMVCEDSPSRALMYISTGKKFANAAISNEGNGAYSYVTLGICPYPTYTTNPVLSQGFSITNTAMVTSASGQKVKAASALTLETRNIELPCTFTISAPNITFYDTNGNEVTELTSSTASEQFELHFAYKPTAENTIEYPTITIVDDEMKTYTIKNRIYARSLPATFAVVAKVGNLWYALPSQGLNSTTPPAAYPVEVDDMADPTAVTAVPENADWSLRGVYEASRSDATKDRYVANGDNLVFVNNASPAMVLNASSSEEENYLLTDAQYANYYETNPGLYEWTPTTTDLETYQLTNEQRGRTLSVNTATVFGVHAQNKAVEQVRFLPIQNRYTPAALQVVEWKENSVVIMYNGDPAQTAAVSVNGGAAQETVLSSASAQRDIAVYELTADGLAANPTQRLSITIGTDKVILPIPYIISGSKNDKDVLPGSTVAARQDIAKVSDLVILKGATLTAAGAKSNPYKFRNATIYGGGKLVIPSDKGFGVASLTLRAGGIKDAGEYDYVYDYVYPQFELRGTFTNSAAKINYDYITDYDHWYHLVLPFAGDLGTIKYPTEFYGANVAANNKGSWQIKRYAGEIRATGNYNAWKDIEDEGETSTIAGQGYIFWGAPKKVSVNGGASTRQKWGIQRITMSVTADDAETEKADKTIAGLGSYEDVPNKSKKVNDQGWNLIGNPYMVNLTTMSEVGLKAGKLEPVNDAAGNWTGKWFNNGDGIRYLTIPSNHFDTYEAKTVSAAKDANNLVPGRAFFVQLEGEADGVTFAAANRASLMPALLAENNDKPVDIETGIVLSNETMQDEVNFWIKDGKTNNYEYNADYPKTPNNNHFNIYGVHTNGDLSWVATSPEYAAESMPIGYQVPAAGTFTLSVSETYYSENLQALFVTDHEASPEVTTNLVDEDYTFYVNQAETNNTRFTVSIILKPEKENTPTGVDNINTKANQPIKFLYQDKIYILRNGMIYDTTGKQVITINK